MYDWKVGAMLERRALKSTPQILGSAVVRAGWNHLRTPPESLHWPVAVWIMALIAGAGVNCVLPHMS